MSQITRMGGGGPTPSGAVLTLSGDGGIHVSPDGTGNIDINGAGGINVVSDPGTNSLTITDTNAGTKYNTSDGNYAIPIAGVLNVFQGANILTTSAALPSNTVEIALKPDVSITGAFTAGTKITAGDDIDSGGVIQAAFDIIAMRNLIAWDDLQADNAHFGGEVTCHTLQVFESPYGALTTDATGDVTAANGALGTVLTSNGVGTQPTFQAVTFPAAPTVTGTANEIAVSAGPNYVVSLPAAVTAPGSLATTTTLSSGSTITAATNITSTLGNITATHGNIVLTNGEMILAGNAGTVGQVFTSAGPTATPTWTTPTPAAAKPYFQYTNAAMQTIVAAGKYIVQFPNLIVDTTGGLYDSLTGIFTAGATGIYIFGVNIAYTSFHNYALLQTTTNYYYFYSDSSNSHINGSIMVPMTLGDTAYIFMTLGGVTGTIYDTASTGVDTYQYTTPLFYGYQLY